MNTNYFSEVFESMSKKSVQDFLRNAQIDLDNARGAKRALLCEAIRAAACELKFRYVHKVS